MSSIGTKLDANQVFKQAYDEDLNRIRVDAQVVATIGQVEVELNSSDGDNVAISDGTNTASVNANGGLNVNVLNDIELDIDAASGDNIAISDGTNRLVINGDGSVNVNIGDTQLTTKNIFNEISSVASGVTSNVISLVASQNTKLLSVAVGGENVAQYSVYIGGDLSARKYTYFTELNANFDFADGLPVLMGDVITVQVLHNRPDPGSFSANILLKGLA